MSADGPAEEEVQGVGGTVAGQCQTCPHSAPRSHTMPRIAAQRSEQGDGAPVTSAVRRATDAV
jgi:hypothetical protein